MMAKRVFPLVILITACTSLLTTDSSARQQNSDAGTAVITGQVVNERNEPIDGVEVKAFRGAERVAKDRTKNGGQYTLQFRHGALVSVVVYANYDFCPGSINNVSGRTAHNITKVLYKRNPNVRCPNNEEARAALDYIRAHPQHFPEERQAYADLLNEVNPRVVPPRVARPLLWREPTDIASRDLILGPGGAAMRPDLSKITFLKEEKGGYLKEYRVRDGAGREWVVKVGKQAQSETAATRLLWAVGYNTEITYLAPRVHITGKGTFENALFEARPKNVKQLATWKWVGNPFTGTRELKGLKVMMVLLNNWDVKDSNIVILRHEDTGEIKYAISDLGATLGDEGRGKTLWHIPRSRNYPADYDRDMLIGEVKEDGRVDLRYPGKKRDIFNDITVDDARWIGSWLARLSDRQLADAFRAANYTPVEVRLMTEAVRKRINELVYLHRNMILR